MPVSNSWTNPSAAGTLDLATGAILTETWTDAVASNFLFLGGTAGVITATNSPSVSTSGPTTTSSGMVNIPDMTVTITCQGSTSVLCWGTCELQESVSGTVATLGLSMDGAAASGSIRMAAPAAGLPFCIAVCFRFVPTAGSHVFTLQWATSAATLTGLGVGRQLIVSELRR